MSYKVSAAAWLTTTGKPLTKLVLVALAEFADDSGFCWPSIQTLAKRCESSESSIRRGLRQLQSLGLLKVKFSKGKNSNRYTLSTLSNRQGTNGQPCQADTPTLSNRHPNPVRLTPDPIRKRHRTDQGKPRISDCERIGLEKEREELKKRISILSLDEFRTEVETSELQTLRDRKRKIDSALHIPL